MKTKDDLLCKDPRTNVRLSFAILVAYGVLLSGFLGIVFFIYGITHLIIR
jgi:energy-converting hydrogenase Eha subunit G